MYLPTPTEGNDFTPPPHGAWPAICYRVIDLGTQPVTYKGETKHKHRVLISWEIADQEERMDDGRPFTISKSYTWSTHEKSELRKDLENWRGAKFTESDFGEGGFNIKNIIGKQCLISIVHKIEGDKTYANVSSISKPAKGMQFAPLENEEVYLCLASGLFDQAAFDKLSDHLKGKIKASPEYMELTKNQNNVLPPEKYPDKNIEEIPF